MPPIKFWLNLTIMWFEEFQDGPWTLERKDFGNSESLCHCDASHQDPTYSLGGDDI